MTATPKTKARRLWTEEEDAVLRDVARRRVPLIDEMHRLPGRTWAGARQHAWNHLKLRLGKFTWTEAEREILRQIYASDEAIKHAVARLLPERTYTAAKQEAVRLQIVDHDADRIYGRSLIFYRIERVLADGRKASIQQLATELKASVSATKRALVKQRGVRARVGGYERLWNGTLAELWVLGAGPDAPRPARKTHSEACRQKRARAKVRAGRIDPFATLRQQVAA